MGTSRSSSLVARLSILVLSFGAACDPGSTRPDVTPFPDAKQIEVILDRAEAITMLRDVLVADSFPITRFSPRDAWLESPWMDRRTLRPVGDGGLGPDVVRLRAWADPARPGNSFLTVELAWRPTIDPSVPKRTLERLVPARDSLSLRVAAALKRVNDRFGFHGPPATGGTPADKPAERGRP